MRNLSIIIIIAACLFGCGHNVTIQQAEPSNQGNLRFERNRLIVSVMLPDSTAMEFELDSGCANGHATIDSATLVKLQNIAPQDIDTNNQHIQSLIDSQKLTYRYYINQHTKPLIGLNCKDSLLRWHINISQGRLEIIPNDSVADFSRFEAIPLRIAYGLLPIVELPITLYKNGKKHSFKRSFLVDTGAPSAFCFTDPDSELLSFVESIPHCEYDDALTEIFSKQGRQREYINFISDSVAIQSFNVGKASCGIDIGVRSARREFGDGVVGVIGMGVLKHFDIVFDYKNQQLLLAPHGIDMPFYEQAESGLGFKYSKDLRVSFVARGHNAQKAGLKLGDRIEAINGISREKLLDASVMDSLRTLPDNTPLHLQLKRGGEDVIIEYLSCKTI